MRALFRSAPAAALLMAAAPARAAGDSFFSLANTDFIVLLGFLLFITILIYFKVPGRLGKMLDDRAARIKSEIDEARALREEAQTLLASYERKSRDVEAQAARIVETAKAEAIAAAEQAKKDLEETIARRLRTAEDQIATAEDAAVRTVRDRAITVAVAAAGEVMRGQLSAEDAGRLVDSAIDTVAERLH